MPGIMNPSLRYRGAEGIDPASDPSFDQKLNDLFQSPEAGERKRRKKVLADLLGGDEKRAEKYMEHFGKMPREQFELSIQAVAPKSKHVTNAEIGARAAQQGKTKQQVIDEAEQQFAENTNRQAAARGQREVGKPVGPGGEIYTEKPRSATAEAEAGMSEDSKFRGLTNQRARRRPKDRIDPVEIRLLQEQNDEFGKWRHQMTQQYGRLDPLGKKHFNDMQKALGGLETAFSKGDLRAHEYLRSMKEVYDRTKMVQWQYHTAPPGSQPGEHKEQDGIVYLVRPGGENEPIAYTSDYIKQNTIDLGDGRKLVPTQPGKGLEVVDGSKEREKIHNDSAKMFDEMWDKMSKAFMEENKTKDPNGVGRLPGQPGWDLQDPQKLQDEQTRFVERVHNATVDRMYNHRRLAKRLEEMEADPNRKQGAIAEAISNQLGDEAQGYQAALTDHVQKLQGQLIQDAGQPQTPQAAPPARSVYNILNQFPEVVRSSPKAQELAKKIEDLRASTGGDIPEGSELHQQIDSLVRELMALKGRAPPK